MNSKLKNESTDFLFDAILLLDNKEECYRFFEDLCTSAELKAMSQRLVVAKMLTEKKVYTEIVKETGASNSREFVCKVSALGKSQTGSPKKSKKEAQISAAEKLLRILNA